MARALMRAASVSERDESVVYGGARARIQGRRSRARQCRRQKRRFYRRADNVWLPFLCTLAARAVTQPINQSFSTERPAPRAPVRASTPETIAASQMVGRIARLLAESRARAATIAPLLPPALRTQVQGGIPEAGQPWSLFVPKSSAASRLRQMLPTLLAALQRAGHDVPKVVVKVRAPRS